MNSTASGFHLLRSGLSVESVLDVFVGWVDTVGRNHVWELSRVLFYMCMCVCGVTFLIYFLNLPWSDFYKKFVLGKTKRPTPVTGFPSSLCICPLAFAAAGPRGAGPPRHRSEGPRGPPPEPSPPVPTVRVFFIYPRISTNFSDQSVISQFCYIIHAQWFYEGRCHLIPFHRRAEGGGISAFWGRKSRLSGQQIFFRIEAGIGGGLRSSPLTHFIWLKITIEFS